MATGKDRCMDYEKLRTLHDRLLYLESAAKLFAASDRCTSDTENAFFLIAGYVKSIRMELFEVIGEGSSGSDRKP